MNFVTITISGQTLNTVGAALQELPYKLAQPAISEINAQVQKALDEEEKRRGALTQDRPAGNANGGENGIRDESTKAA